jgi:hypothetical protein
MPLSFAGEEMMRYDMGKDDITGRVVDLPVIRIRD